MSTLVEDCVQDRKSDSQASYNDHQQIWIPDLYSMIRLFGKNIKTEFLSSRLGFSQMQDALICIPQEWLDTTRMECMRERDLDETLGNTKTQLSKNDTMIAWFLKLLYGYDSRPNEPVDLHCPFDIQGFTKKDSETPYLHNDFSMLRCHLTAADLKSKPIHWIADRVRNALLFYRNTASVRDYWRFLEDSASKIKVLGSTGQSVMITSLAAFDFGKLDFSGAMDAHDDDNMCPPVLFVCPKVMPRLLSAADGLFVIWKDAYEDFWIRGCMSVDAVRGLDVL